MNDQQRIITDNASLRAQYDELAANDIVVGRVRLKPSEEHILLDLIERGVRLIPSALSQLASRSKCMQTRLFSRFMLPHTLAIHDLNDLVEAVNLYSKNKIKRVVTKLDRRNAGQGIHLWSSIEEIYTQASFGVVPLPFVVQPFYPDCRDIRVIVLDQYVEAYQRHNPHNFRNNLHCGGESSPCELSKEHRELCRAVMARGHFTCAHVDIMVTKEGASFLAEINLRGGIRGAKIDQPDYSARVAAINEKLLQAAIG